MPNLLLQYIDLSGNLTLLRNDYQYLSEDYDSVSCTIVMKYVTWDHDGGDFSNLYTTLPYLPISALLDVWTLTVCMLSTWRTLLAALLTQYHTCYPARNYFAECPTSWPTYDYPRYPARNAPFSVQPLSSSDQCHTGLSGID